MLRNIRGKSFVYAAVFAMVAVLGFSTNAYAKRKSDNSKGMEITATGELLKYADTSEKNHGVVIPKSVKMIHDEVFAGCKKITSIKFEKPENITSIGKGAFSGTSIKTFTVPKNIEVLDDNVFNGCSNLKDIKLNNKLVWIGEGCFIACHSLKKVTVTNNVEFLGDSAFANCSGLKTVKLPKDLAWIGDNCFSGCTKLDFKKGELPKGLIRIGSKAFQNCTNLKQIVVYGNILADTETQERGIGTACFSNCKNLKSFKLVKKKIAIRPKKLLEIGEIESIRELKADLFSNCEKLKEVSIGDFFIERIDDTIFDGCHGTITLKAPKWLYEKTVKDFIDNFKSNTAKLKYKEIK